MTAIAAGFVYLLFVGVRMYLTSCFRSDSTAVAITNVWYYLLRNPAQYARLQAEVDAAFPSGEEPFDQEKLSAMPFLLACM
jgi:Cytochrome P450